MGSENLWIIFLLVGTGLLAGGGFFFMRTNATTVPVAVSAVARNLRVKATWGR